MHTWWKVPGERVAHAFTNGPGWTRSACGEVRWDVRFRRVGDHPLRRCPACVVAVTTGIVAGPAMGEAEAREAFGV